MEIVLSIAIPTWRRPRQLGRLLAQLSGQIPAESLVGEVEVVVSDNGSGDDSPRVLASAETAFTPSGTPLRWVSQSENRGFDENIRAVHGLARGRWIWFLADDDIPAQGSIARILATLREQDPDLLRFSFEQPPGSRARQFEHPEACRTAPSGPELIDYIVRYQKISTYVLRRRPADVSANPYLRRNIGPGFYNLALAVDVLASSAQPRAVSIAEQLAACDDGFQEIPWNPAVLLDQHIPLEHPFVKTQAPQAWRLRWEEGYLGAIQFAFAGQVGALRYTSPGVVPALIRKLDWRWSILLAHPRGLGQLIALKTGSAAWWPKLQRLLSRPGASNSAKEAL